jgi:hypothetical protein
MEMWFGMWEISGFGGLTGFLGAGREGSTAMTKATARFRRRNGMGREAGFSAAQFANSANCSGRNDRFWVVMREQAKAMTEADPLRG